MPLLSIVIPVYNVENYLDECLNSILNQSYSDYEVILVDNASTDKSGKICDEYALKYKNIKVIHLEVNSLPAGARNVGLQNATGEYVHFCDSDDYYIKNTFKSIVDTLKKHSPDVLFGQFISKPEKGAYVCNNTQLDLSKFKQEDPIEIIQYISSMPNFLGTTWRFIVNRCLLVENSIIFPEGYHSEDEEWVPKVLCNAQSFFLLEEPFYCYRPRAKHSITAARTFIQSKSKLAVAFNLLKFIHKENYLDIRKEFIYSRINMLLGTFTTRCDTFSKQEINELGDIIKENKDVFQELNKIKDRYDLYYSISTYGPYEGLRNYCQNTVKETLEIAKGKEDRDIYIFPTGNNGESTARILQKCGYKVKGFFDNSKSKNNCIIDGLTVSLPNKLNFMSSDELKNLFIIVSVQQRDIASAIMNQLSEYGLNEDQFISRIY